MNVIKNAGMGVIAVLLIMSAANISAKDCGNGIAPCECGDTVVSDWTFAGDMACPAGVAEAHGLTIGADGVTIDGAGYRMTGSKTALVCDWIGEANPNSGYCGVNNLGYDNVVIRNLEITDFCTGIGLQGSGANPVVGNTIEGCEIHGNGDADCSTDTSTHGMHVCYISRCVIRENRIYENTGTGAGCGDGGNGIFIYAGGEKFANNTVTGNEIYNNRKGGFFAKKGMQYAEITDNHVYGNGQGGIVLRCMNSNYNLIEGNNASANSGDGIFIGSQYNVIRNNVVTGNVAGFRIKERDVIGDGDGIDMGRSGDSHNNTLISNTVCGNDGVDIDVAVECVGNHGRDNTCDTTNDYADEGAAAGGCSERCDEGATEQETPAADTTASDSDSASASDGDSDTSELKTPGFGAVFAIAGLFAVVLVTGLRSCRRRNSR